MYAAALKVKKVKPIEGSWFEFQHHNLPEGKYWNSTLENFTCQQWDTKVKEIANAGLKYLVLLDVAIYDKSFYPSTLLSQHKWNARILWKQFLRQLINTMFISSLAMDFLENGEIPLF